MPDIAMYSLDARETHILRSALVREGSPASLAMLGTLPVSGHPPTDIAGRDALTAVTALDAYCSDRGAYGYLAKCLADALAGRKPARADELART